MCGTQRLRACWLIHIHRTCAKAVNLQRQMTYFRARAMGQRTAMQMMRQALQLYALVASALLLEVTTF